MQEVQVTGKRCPVTRKANSVLRFPPAWRDSLPKRLAEDVLEWLGGQFARLERPLNRFDEAFFSNKAPKPFLYLSATLIVLLSILYLFSQAHHDLGELSATLTQDREGESGQLLSDDERLFQQLLAEAVIWFEPKVDSVRFVPRDCLQMNRPSKACPMHVSRDALRMLHASAPGAVIRQEIKRWNSVRSLVAVRGLLGVSDTSDSQSGLWKSTIEKTGIIVPSSSLVPEEFGFIHQGRLSTGFADWNSVSGLEAGSDVTFKLDRIPINRPGSREFVVQLIGCLDQRMMERNRAAGWQVYRIPDERAGGGQRPGLPLLPLNIGDSCDVEAGLAYRLTRPWPGLDHSVKVHTKPTRFSPDSLPGYALRILRSSWSAMRAESISGESKDLTEVQKLVDLRGRSGERKGTSSEIRILQENFSGDKSAWRIEANKPGVHESEYRLTIRMPEDLASLKRLSLAVFGSLAGVELVEGVPAGDDATSQLPVEAEALWSTRTVVEGNSSFIRIFPRVSAFGSFSTIPSLQFIFKIRHAQDCRTLFDDPCGGIESLQYTSVAKRSVDVVRSAGLYLYSRDLAPNAGEDFAKYALLRPAPEGGSHFSEAVRDLGIGPIVGLKGLERSRVSGVVPEVFGEFGPQRYQLSIDQRLQEIAQGALERQVEAMANADSGGTREFSDQRRGALIVLDADTGAILAAPSAPSIPAGANNWDIRSFDRIYPKFSPMQHSGWEVLNRHYAPGSTFKPMNALLAAQTDLERGWELNSIRGVTHRKSYEKLSRAIPGIKIEDPDAIRFGDPKWGWNPELRNFAPSGARWNDPKGIGLDVGIENSLNVYMAYLALARHQHWLDEELSMIPECTSNQNSDSKIYVSADAVERSPLITLLKQFGMIAARDDRRPVRGNDLGWPLLHPGRSNASGSIFSPAVGRVSIREEQPAQPAYTVVKGIQVGCKALSESIRHKLALHGIGQGVALTPLDVARIAAIIAGAAARSETSDAALIPVDDVHPFLIEPYPATSMRSRSDGRTSNSKKAGDAMYSRDAIRLLAKGMHSVVTSGTAERAFRGTGLTNRSHVSTLYGKTGTADVRQRPGEPSYNSVWFMGWYAPSDKAQARYRVRRLAFACFLSHGYGKFRFGGQACAPVVANFLTELEAPTNSSARAVR